MIFMTPSPPNWEVSASSSYLFISPGLCEMETSIPASWFPFPIHALKCPACNYIMETYDVWVLGTSSDPSSTQSVPLMAPFDIIVRVGDVSFFLDPQITLFSLPSAPFNDTKKTQSRSNDISRKAVAGTPSSTGCGLLTPFFQNPSVHTYLLMVPGSKIVGLMIPLSSCCVRNISDTHSNSVCRQEWMVISTCDPSHVLSRIALGFQEGEYLQARLQILQCISIYFHQYVSPFLPQFLNRWWQSF